ncbi:hypothetical protein A9264_13590 [Vibrio sp. UCD-FRSSP16_10]|uniref:type II secretion system protein n=1 Tax=unclassified Vibrio TaxID=2614977 RepID=UPI0007FC1F0B|nr:MULTISPECIES: type II secretion system protein [unclassified Vibrio]OBT14804.1 hypothetical protein A9260_13805 [Vibrio sp. UCD-FRSSP16_30]OBT20093.1 hypothetical protein A9264_13590 [Vibrio sp. UCD-FRSSP16_10]
MSNNNGFTLIELVTVIVVLGILAITAAPRFINLSSDSRISVMESLKGSVISAVDMVHAQAVIDSEDGKEGKITIGNTPVELTYGYPTNDSIYLALDISDDVLIFETSDTASYWYHSDAPSSQRCRVTYNANAINSPDKRPVITIVTEPSENMEGC